MKGTRISEKTFELIKQMLIQGYSVKKISQMLPEEIKVSTGIIYKVDKYATYAEYCGQKPEPEKPKESSIISHANAKELIAGIKGTNDRLDKLCEMLGELISMLQ